MYEFLMLLGFVIAATSQFLPENQDDVLEDGEEVKRRSDRSHPGRIDRHRQHRLSRSRQWRIRGHRLQA